MSLNWHSYFIVRVLFLCYDLGIKEMIFLRDIYLHPNKYIDSYDNECFAPQFWEDEECIVITTLTPLKTNV